MKVWITKYVLTNGILEEEAEICQKISDEMIEITTNKNSLGKYYHGKDWHKTKDAAIERANEMLSRKVETMEKQLKKLKALKFK